MGTGSNNVEKRTRIVAFGGGISTLAALFDLTSKSDWKDQYDINVYQMGWRLGGKGASSRNPAFNDRIEEHGLHIWLGFYENAFQIIRRCYAELEGKDGVFASWNDAFKPHNFVVLMEKLEQGWLPWAANLPTNESTPGDGKGLPTLWDYLEMLVEEAQNAFEKNENIRPIGADDKVDEAVWSSAVMTEELKPDERARLHPSLQLLVAARRRAHRMRQAKRHRTRQNHQEVHSILAYFQSWLHRNLQAKAQADSEVRHTYVILDLFCTTAIGLLGDDLLTRGLDIIDSFELRAWLKRHRASDISLNSASLRVGYDLAFSFEDGDSTKPNIAAGVAVRSMLRLLLGFKGSVLWKMQAGMGETVFTPLYLVLCNRGVKFHFFHRLDSFEPSLNHTEIDQVQMTLQATVKAEEYNPLIRVNGLDCWHFGPDFDQLVEGAQLQDRKVNLESNWSGWPGVGTITLKRGRDFDTILSGIPVAALKTVGTAISVVNRRWADLFEHVKTIQTQGFQLWLDKDLAGCGWSQPSPVLGAFVEPIDTWSDMSHLLKMESWPADATPKQLAYFCGVMKGAVHVPDPNAVDFPQQESDRSFETCADFLTNYVRFLWPSTTSAVPKEEFDWKTLFSAHPIEGKDRLKSQYWHPNIDPSERYTLSVAGSVKYRLSVEGSGYSNVILTGDWIRNGFNTPGCIESAVISGRQAARAIKQGNYHIIGETDFPPVAQWWLRVFLAITSSLSRIAEPLLLWLRPRSQLPNHGSRHLTVGVKKFESDR